MNDDAAYKTFFSIPEMVKSILLDFVHEDFVKDFDFNSLEACSGSYVSEDLEQRHGDCVWRVKWQNGWCYIFILLEFQSRTDYWMALRISSYTNLLWENLVKQKFVKHGDKLPPVFPVVIYNGEKPWTAPMETFDLVDNPHDQLAQYQTHQKYFLVDIYRISQKLLNNTEGKAALILRFERAKTAKDFILAFKDLKTLLSKDEYSLLDNAINKWIGLLLHKRGIIINTEEIRSEDGFMGLEERMAQWEQEFFQNGVAKGFADGEAKGFRQAILDILDARFGEVPQDLINNISKLTDIAILSQLTKSVVKLNSLDEVKTNLFQYVKEH